MRKFLKLYALFLMFIFCTSCKGQTKTILQADSSMFKGLISPYGPTSSVRTIIQDRQGNIWLASNEGIIRYDGKTFTNITGNLSSDRFFSVLQDRNENFWFGNYGSGVYYYNGKSLQHFTTKEGLLVIKFPLFMKIKPVIFGLELMEGQAVTMENRFEII